MTQDHAACSVKAAFRKLNLAGFNGNKPLKAKPFNPKYSVANIKEMLMSYCLQEHDPEGDEALALYMVKALKASMQAELHLEQNPSDKQTQAWMNDLNKQVGSEVAQAFESRHPHFKKGILECDGWVDLLHWTLMDYKAA